MLKVKQTRQQTPPKKEKEIEILRWTIGGRKWKMEEGDWIMTE